MNASAVPTHRNLSAIISAFLPNSLSHLNLRANWPSSQSVSAAIAKIVIVVLMSAFVKIKYIMTKVRKTLDIVKKFGMCFRMFLIN